MERAYPYQVAVIGGDARQIQVALALSELFSRVKVFGHPSTDLPDSITMTSSLPEAIAEAKVIVLPISGMNDAGMVRGYNIDQYYDFGSFFATLPEEALLVTGSLTSKWLQIAEGMKVSVLQYAEDDEIAILNSIPTAEGAVQIAMEQLPITIHGSTAVLIGFGKVGVTTARVFKALNARVIVCARRPALQARAVEMGCEAVSHRDLPEVLTSANIIINTVPAPVLGAAELAKVASDAVIIDLASPPGGTDFETARQLNLKAILAPGLPGKVAPQTAGKILALTIPKLIEKFWNGGGRQ